jgi:hypothetical protein
MLDDANEESPGFDPSDVDVVQARYLQVCSRLGVEPVPRDRAHELVFDAAHLLLV